MVVANHLRLMIHRLLVVAVHLEGLVNQILVSHQHCQLQHLLNHTRQTVDLVVSHIHHRHQKADFVHTLAVHSLRLVYLHPVGGLMVAEVHLEWWEVQTVWNQFHFLLLLLLRYHHSYCYLGLSHSLHFDHQAD